MQKYCWKLLKHLYVSLDYCTKFVPMSGSSFMCKQNKGINNNFHLFRTKKGASKYLCCTILYFTCTKYNHSNLKRLLGMTLKVLSTTDDCIIRPQIEMTVAILWAHKPILAMAWPFSGVGFHLVSWWRALYGPPALRVWTSKNSDCKVDGAHTQPGKRHHAGAKWHFNSRCILGVCLSGYLDCGHGHDARDWLVEGHREANKAERVKYMTVDRNQMFIRW